MAEATAQAVAGHDDGDRSSSDDETISLTATKKPTKKQKTVATIEYDLAKEAVEVAPFRETLLALDRACDEEYLKSAQTSPDGASGRSLMPREDLVQPQLQVLKIDNWIRARFALVEILETEDHVARIKAEAAMLVARAERKLKIRELLLRHQLVEWALAVPLEQRHSEKTVRFPGTTKRITFKNEDPHWEVESEYKALDSVTSVLGEDRAIARGLIKLRPSLDASELKAALSENRISGIEGTKFVPKHDEPIFYRT